MIRQPYLRLGLTWLLVLTACGRDDASAPAGRTAPAQDTATAPPHAQATDAATAAPPPWQPLVPVVAPDDAARTLAQARQALLAGRLERGSSPGPGALELFLGVRAISPDEPAVRQGLQDTLDALLEHGRLAADRGDLAEAARIDAIARAVQPDHRDLPAFRAHVALAAAAARLLRAAEIAERQGHLVEPANTSALDFLRRARATLPVFQPVEDRWRRWHAQRLQRAWKAASDEDYARAEHYLAEARRLRPEAPDNAVMDLRIVELRTALTEALLAQGNAAVDRLDLAGAQSALTHAARVAAQPDRVEALRERIHLARHYGLHLPGDVFADRLAAGGKGPELVVLPYGRFNMGAIDADAPRAAAEVPRHEVRFARGFALARSEITVGQFRRFIAASGYRPRADQSGRSTLFDERAGQMVEREGVDWRSDYSGHPAAADLPVLHVAFEDAKAYADWLSQQTGQRYTVPSEAQFEYALRAGTDTRYPWGDAAPGRVVGNLAGEGDRSPAGRPWGNAVAGYRDGFWGPAPVRRFAPEGFGTFDLVGNVAEWTADCWHDSYRRAPADGSAWINPGCRRRVVRGASWASSLDQARASFRMAADAATTGARLGFRVAREL